jgi:hypothetical protein
MATNVADLLAAQSLLLAAITALTALWSGDLESAREDRPKGQAYKDNVKAHAALKRALWRRAVPLFLYSTVLTGLVVPTSITIVVRTVRFWMGEHAGLTYDPISASLVLVHAGLAALALHLGAVLKDIYQRHRAYEELRKSAGAAA